MIQNIQIILNFNKKKLNFLKTWFTPRSQKVSPDVALTRKPSAADLFLSRKVRYVYLFIVWSKKDTKTNGLWLLSWYIY